MQKKKNKQYNILNQITNLIWKVKKLIKKKKLKLWKKLFIIYKVFDYIYPFICKNIKIYYNFLTKIFIIWKDINNINNCTNNNKIKTMKI